jgi:hypothetical protein
MTRSLLNDIDLFLARLRKTHPGLKGIVIGINYPSGKLTYTIGDLKGSKSSMCEAIRQHENRPLEDS